MNEKRPFLLAKARSFTMEDLQGHYDEDEQLNVEVHHWGKRPLVLADNYARTESKTMQAPGDDDPDPEAEGCY